ncbi:acetyltransferase [Haloechinothrix sp. YIM 98757]|uniref:Lysine N-acyltransferase MbtK n=1 Tax=Haloechinothrix aidingensis TaxID=2752311 RepID=A0A838AD14_9PSEU|nr:GNAT family N-acetyltransferase [Haloechinothrix aidingensis]MBA0127162.1 acetyltransferase [Haloechinothrix aidingensis]
MSARPASDGEAGPPPVPRLPEPWSVRVASGDADVELVHRWMIQPHVEKYWQQAWTPRQWRDEFDRQLAGAHSLPCLVAHDGVDIAYIEVYRVARDGLADYVPHEPHDLGVHIAIGDRDRTGRGLGRALLAALADGLLAAEPECDRVVAEPDRENTASVIAFRVAGFVQGREVALPDKTAVVMTYERRGPR